MLLQETLSPEEERIATTIVNASLAVHKALGPGLLENISAQILSHMRLAQKRLGFLINFNVPLMKNGIKRFVL